MHILLTFHIGRLVSSVSKYRDSLSMWVLALQDRTHRSRTAWIYFEIHYYLPIMTIPDLSLCIKPLHLGKAGFM